MKKRAYIASILHSDMVRYSGVEPINVDNEFVFIKPNNVNYNWVRHGVMRTRSFGINAKPGWWDNDTFIVDWKVPKTFLDYPPYKYK